MVRMEGKRLPAKAENLTGEKQRREEE